MNLFSNQYQKGIFPIFIKYSLFSTILLAMTGCWDGNDINPSMNGNVPANQWIKDVMDDVYYWEENIGTPLSIDSDPIEYFESLLYRPNDRFSAIYPDYQELVNNLQGIKKEAGYEVIFSRESPANENVNGLIAYVKKGSPAASRGLKRGDVITRINGQRLVMGNYQNLFDLTQESHSISFIRHNDVTQQFEEQEPVSLEVISIAENPNFLDTIYTIDNQKIGYLVYHFFSPGTVAQPLQYNNEMDEVFGRFQAEGINHLILDLRYNGGGYVSSAVNLASLIAPNANSGNVFSRTRYNSSLMRLDQFKDDNTSFISKSQNLGTSLTGNKIHIITSRRTASASELIINGLNPYMNVILIGDITVGKNVGSVPIENEENPEIDYGLLPIVSQSFNSLNQSDYGEGFTPNIPANELSQPVLLPFGDIHEYLLKLSIEQIIGKSGDRLNLIERIDLGSSLERQVRYGKMIEETF